jgi:hypothetical protein
MLCRGNDGFRFRRLTPLHGLRVKRAGVMPSLWLNLFLSMSSCDNNDTTIIRQA